MQRLRRRADFLKAAGGRKVSTPAFVLQAVRRADNDAVRADQDAVRVGFTVSRKVGTAVERNRVRRRLREVVKRSERRDVDGGCLRSGHDYVLIGRRSALQLPFDRMVEELEAALRRLRPL